MQAVQSENGDKSPKKNRAKGLDSEPHEQPYDTSQRKEKRKKRDPEEREESMEHKARLKEAEGESEPPKKRHKNRTNFADPREDTQLNAQSRKGMLYNMAIARLLIFICSSRICFHSDEPPLKMEI